MGVKLQNHLHNLVQVSILRKGKKILISILHFIVT